MYWIHRGSIVTDVLQFLRGKASVFLSKRAKICNVGSSCFQGYPRPFSSSLLRKNPAWQVETRCLCIRQESTHLFLLQNLSRYRFKFPRSYAIFLGLSKLYDMRFEDVLDMFPDLQNEELFSCHKIGTFSTVLDQCLLINKMLQKTLMG